MRNLLPFLALLLATSASAELSSFRGLDFGPSSVIDKAPIEGCQKPQPDPLAPEPFVCSARPAPRDS